MRARLLKILLALFVRPYSMPAKIAEIFGRRAFEFIRKPNDAS